MITYLNHHPLPFGGVNTGESMIISQKPISKPLLRIGICCIVLLLCHTILPLWAIAATKRDLVLHPAVSDPRAIFCLVIFLLSYFFVVIEEKTHLRKSKPVMLGAGIIWFFIALAAPEYDVDHEQLQQAIFHDLDEYGSLFLFLFSAMTYVNTLESSNVFDALRSWLLRKGYSYRQLFWFTGLIAFFLSPIADNMTTALVMGAVIMAVGGDNVRFITIAMVNIVVAANSGGAFSPFGDITTLMVWQAGHIEFLEFFALFLPSLATFLVTAGLMSYFIPATHPSSKDEQVNLQRGAKRAIFLFMVTISMAVCFEQFLGLPPFLGMMTGLSLLMLHTYSLKLTRRDGEPDYDIFASIKEIEWDTLLFFFGVMFSVGGLAFIGYLTIASTTLYGSWGATFANIILGTASAVVDNIPIMFSVLSMHPEMDRFQWLLVTFTCGVGGSLLAIGSAAGVALLGASKGKYTFASHLKWTPIIMLGYATGILTHFVVN